MAVLVIFYSLVHTQDQFEVTRIPLLQDQQECFYIVQPLLLTHPSFAGRMKEYNIFQSLNSYFPHLGISVSDRERIGESKRLPLWRENTHMLLSCSPPIRINGSHDTAWLLSLIQPLMGSQLTFNRVFLLCTKERSLCRDWGVVEFSGWLAFNTSQCFCGFPNLPAFDVSSRFSDIKTKGWVD